MNIVLLSGGSGKRLWPLSNDTYSKQFLKLLKNDAGEYESMVQRVFSQYKAANPDADIYISCNLSHSDELQKHVGHVEPILEPERRDTFPAVSLAAAYLYYKKRIDVNEVFLVCPIDVFADNRFFELLREAEKLVASEQFKLGLIGTKPIVPTDKYGYIMLKNGKVTGFVNKPLESTAHRCMADGALWNCGIYALKIGYALKYARNYVDFDSFESLFNNYSKLPCISFDDEVTEKECSIGTVTYDGVWKDLGTWNTLTEEIPDTSLGGNILISESCKNTHVLNMLDIPIILQDVSDAIVVAGPDGILVSSKHGTSNLKPLVEQL